MRILLLAPRFPYPPIKGDTARVWHLLRCLGREHEFTLLTFGNQGDLRYLPYVSTFCKRVETIPFRRRAAAVSILRALPTRTPLQVAIYRSSLMARSLRRVLHGASFDIAQVTLVRMAPYLRNPIGVPRILDLIDTISVGFQRWRERNSLLRPFIGAETMRLSRYEQVACGEYDVALVVSEAERAALAADNVRVVPIGVDPNVFRPEDPAKRDPFLIVFSGNLGYAPNIDAAQWLGREILPLVQRAVPAAHLLILGANPAARVRSLSRLPGIEVRGWVDDLPAALAGAAVAACPTRFGAGMQFKVIEAMACGLPVVATPIAAAGLPAAAREMMLVGRNAEELGDAIIRVLADRNQQMTCGLDGRSYVLKHLTWDHAAAALNAIYLELASSRSPLEKKGRWTTSWNLRPAAEKEP